MVAGLLVVDNDDVIDDDTVGSLRAEASEVERVATGEAAARTLESARFDLILLDLGLLGSPCK